MFNSNDDDFLAALQSKLKEENSKKQKITPSLFHQNPTNELNQLATNEGSDNNNQYNQIVNLNDRTDMNITPTKENLLSQAVDDIYYYLSNKNLAVVSKSISLQEKLFEDKLFWETLYNKIFSTDFQIITAQEFTELKLRTLINNYKINNNQKFDFLNLQDDEKIIASLLLNSQTFNQISFDAQNLKSQQIALASQILLDSELYPDLKILIFNSSNLREDDLTKIINAITKNHTLKELNFNHINLSDNILKYLIETIKNFNTSITNIFISNEQKFKDPQNEIKDLLDRNQNFSWKNFDFVKNNPTIILNDVLEKLKSNKNLIAARLKSEINEKLYLQTKNLERLKNKNSKLDILTNIQESRNGKFDDNSLAILEEHKNELYSIQKNIENLEKEKENAKVIVERKIGLLQIELNYYKNKKLTIKDYLIIYNIAGENCYYILDNIDKKTNEKEQLEVTKIKGDVKRDYILYQVELQIENFMDNKFNIITNQLLHLVENNSLLGLSHEINRATIQKISIFYSKWIQYVLKTLKPEEMQFLKNFYNLFSNSQKGSESNFQYPNLNQLINRLNILNYYNNFFIEKTDLKQIQMDLTTITNKLSVLSGINNTIVVTNSYVKQNNFIKDNKFIPKLTLKLKDLEKIFQEQSINTEIDLIKLLKSLLKNSKNDKLKSEILEFYFEITQTLTNCQNSINLENSELGNLNIKNFIEELYSNNFYNKLFLENFSAAIKEFIFHIIIIDIKFLLNRTNNRTDQQNYFLTEFNSLIINYDLIKLAILIFKHSAYFLEPNFFNVRITRIKKNIYEILEKLLKSEVNFFGKFGEEFLGYLDLTYIISTISNYNKKENSHIKDKIEEINKTISSYCLQPTNDILKPYFIILELYQVAITNGLKELQPLYKEYIKKLLTICSQQLDKPSEINYLKYAENILTIPRDFFIEKKLLISDKIDTDSLTKLLFLYFQILNILINKTTTTDQNVTFLHPNNYTKENVLLVLKLIKSNLNKTKIDFFEKNLDNCKIVIPKMINEIQKIGETLSLLPKSPIYLWTQIDTEKDTENEEEISKVECR